jgi:uncharacterized protein (DUF2267 family)
MILKRGEVMVTCAYFEAQEWFNAFKKRLGLSSNERANFIAKEVLHTLRDTLKSEEAISIGWQMPSIVRGIFFEGYDSSREPIIIEDKAEFKSIIDKRCENVSPERAVWAVLSVLNEKCSTSTCLISLSEKLELPKLEIRESSANLI